MIDSRAVRRESLVDVIKSRILLVRVKRQSQIQRQVETDTAANQHPNRVRGVSAAVELPAFAGMSQLHNTDTTATTRNATDAADSEEQRTAEYREMGELDYGAQRFALFSPTLTASSRQLASYAETPREVISASDVPLAIPTFWSSSSKLDTAVEEEKEERDTETDADTATTEGRSPRVAPVRVLPPVRINARLISASVASSSSPSAKSAAAARNYSPRTPRDGALPAIRRPNEARLSRRRHLSDSQGMLVSVPMSAAAAAAATGRITATPLSPSATLTRSTSHKLPGSATSPIRVHAEEGGSAQANASAAAATAEEEHV